MIAFDMAALALGIDSPNVTPHSINYRLASWPPEPDFPIVVDSENIVISVYGDSIWQLWPWSKSKLSFNFSKTTGYGIKKIDEANVNLLKIIAAWWLYGHGSLGSPNTLVRYLSALKPVFAACSAEGILASELHKYPRVIDSFVANRTAASYSTLCYLLHSLSNWKDQLGFEILPPSEIFKLAGYSAANIKSQTPYIPPRIWAYQAERLHECLKDFHEHKSQLVACFDSCVEAYTTHYGTFAKAFDHSKRRVRSSPPFTLSKYNQGCEIPNSGRSFRMLADSAGITNLLTKWIKGSESERELSITSFSKYFTLITYAGLAYILNFSMMRINEAWNLRADCLQVERDQTIGDVYMLQGKTHKTIDDSDARWITSPSVKMAVEAMRTVGKLRMKCAIANPAVDVPESLSSNPWLAVRNYEPWSSANDALGSDSIRANYPSYATFIESFEYLLNKSELIITDTDIKIARDITTGLPEERYREGVPWQFAWHQLRRTGAVNMQGSDYVSIPSMQYQLKHATRVMTLYYGRGYSNSRINKSARDEFVKTMYEMLARELASVNTPRFFSPYGDSRKESIIAETKALTLKEISEGIKKGMFSWRATILGGCTKRGPCPYGGIDNIAHCGGGDGLGACADAVFDTNKIESLIRLKETIKARLVLTTEDAPLFHSLKCQQQALENSINAIKARSI